MSKYLFIGGEFNDQWLEASGDKELVFAELLGDHWNMVCYVRQSWFERTVLHKDPNPRAQEIYVLDSLSDREATQLVNRR
jgi:hypothetical protein